MYLAYKNNSVPAVDRSPDHQPRAFLAKLFWLEPLWLVILAPVITFPSLLPLTMERVAVIALLLFWPFRWLLSKQRAQAWAQNSSLSFLLLWLPITLWVAPNPVLAWQALGFLLFGVALYAMLINQTWLAGRPQYLGWLIVVMGVGVIALTPLVQWKSTFRLFYVPIYDWFQLVPITIGEKIHANVLAGALVQLTILTAALALPPLQKNIPRKEGESGRTRFVKIKLHRSAHYQRWIATTLVILLFILLLLTQSRGAYLGIAVGLITLLLLRWPRLCWLIPFLALLGGLTVYHIGISQAFELLGADNTFGGAEWRTSIWHLSSEALHDFAYTGIGIGNFRPVMTMLYPHPVMTSESANHAHNLALQIGLDIGLPGLFAYYFFTGTLLWQAQQQLRHRVFNSSAVMQQNNENDRLYKRRLIRLARLHNANWALTAGAFATIIGMQVHGLLDAVTWGNKLAFLPWVVFAQITLLYRYRVPEMTEEQARVTAAPASLEVEPSR